MINNNPKTIDTLDIVKEFLDSKKQDGIILDPWDDPDSKHCGPGKENLYLRIVEVKGPLYFESVVDVPRQTSYDNLVITFYRDYEDLAKYLQDFLSKRGINAEVEPFKEGQEEPYIGK